MSMTVLYESAVGFALFDVVETEEIGISLPSVQDAVNDLSKFGKVVKFKAIQPFRSAQEALESINAVSEGEVPDLLQDFLETNVLQAQSKKKSKMVLGVADSKLGQSIAQAVGCKCDHTGVVPELLRGIRLHFTKLYPKLSEVGLDKAQLGLGHSYSRAKVKFNVHRVDNMIIQAIALLDQLDKDINTFGMRVREWYGYHFPELSKIVTENIIVARLAKMIGRRSSLTEDSLEKIEEITMDSAKAEQIMAAAKSSMGMEISDIDLEHVESFANRVISLAEYRASLQEYLRSKMASCAPNLANLIGEQVGARLISHAGSLTNLAKYPASTVQILGAEKALFRALKTKGNTPKYGFLYNSSFISRAGAKNKGRISRYLANKCSIAARIDCFSDTMTGKFGDEMRSQVEERLQFYESGDPPRKNIDVMHKVMETLQGEESAAEEEPKDMDVDAKTPEKKKKEKKKKAKRTAAEADADEEEETVAKTPKSDKKKKKKKSKDKDAETPKSAKKDKKKKKRKSEA
ncbi:nucleolar protein 5A [Salpingoeca rosetta]|uniref:Nucleolar protein 56 n=1 Tax=Salpingoeca rosetta (strain ATCC 50818 / BSB-021) TaxID=946362 RepID=F2UB20_SALR5|nr:nucleolar protein 5A [Salpingoeca rosetta]EGD74033.1 nucleolar protein 5A [Salpingoeca rosetta]|eukprot:XP_004993595.1 nucleolar protein 5A [Salpingoeca rosetta]